MSPVVSYQSQSESVVSVSQSRVALANTLHVGVQPDVAYIHTVTVHGLPNLNNFNFIEFIV